MCHVECFRSHWYLAAMEGLRNSNRAISAKLGPAWNKYDSAAEYRVHDMALLFALFKVLLFSPFHCCGSIETIE